VIHTTRYKKPVNDVNGWQGKTGLQVLKKQNMTCSDHQMHYWPLHVICDF